MLQGVYNLLKLLGNIPEPLGIAYAASPPADALTPAGKRHDCIINYTRMARTQKKAVYFTADVQGCRGGWVYLGFLLPPPEGIAQFVTTGGPGFEGERYMPAPASIHRFFAALDLQPAPAPYCIIQPLSLFTEALRPEFVVFHCRGEALTGLCQLAYFALDAHDAVVMPFGAGCSNILAWPQFYCRQGMAKAVVGGVDPSCRPFMKVDELTFTVSFETFQTMLKAAPHSFLHTKTWVGVRKRIEKSKTQWKEQQTAETTGACSAAPSD